MAYKKKRKSRSRKSTSRPVAKWAWKRLALAFGPAKASSMCRRDPARALKLAKSTRRRDARRYSDKRRAAAYKQPGGGIMNLFKDKAIKARSKGNIFDHAAGAAKALVHTATGGAF